MADDESDWMPCPAVVAHVEATKHCHRRRAVVLVREAMARLKTRTVSDTPYYLDRRQISILLWKHEKNYSLTTEEICRRAQIKAAERDTSISALVKAFLVGLASEEPGARGLEREERELRARVRSFTAGNRLSRDDAYGRDR